MVTCFGIVGWTDSWFLRAVLIGFIGKMSGQSKTAIKI